MNEVEPPRGAAEAGDNPCLKISQRLCSIWGEQYDGFCAAGFGSHGSAAMRREHLSFSFSWRSRVCRKADVVQGAWTVLVYREGAEAS